MIPHSFGVKMPSDCALPAFLEESPELRFAKVMNVSNLHSVGGISYELGTAAVVASVVPPGREKRCQVVLSVVSLSLE